jgi:hypothetical protein
MADKIIWFQCPPSWLLPPVFAGINSVESKVEKVKPKEDKKS